MTLQIALAILLPAVEATADNEAPDTWRLDYYHTGGLGTEIFSLDKIVVEPLPWAGHPAGHLDPSKSGPYCFEVRDAAGRVVYSRGFSSIFAEWTTTAEARRMHRTFHESLRFPAPDGPVDVVVQKRDRRNAFEEAWRITVDPDDMFIDRALPPRQKVLEIERHGEPRDKVDLLMLGDGYTAGERAEKFEAHARRMTEALFRYEPFRRRRGDFNVWGICPPSPEPGVSRPSTGVHVASPVGATYDVFGIERYVLTFDNRSLRDLAAWAPYEFVVILVNSETYGGGGVFNLFATVAADNQWAEYILVHEFGHHFAELADEYYVSPVPYEMPEEIVEPWAANVTALLDPSALKWTALLTEGIPIPTPWPKETFEKHAKALQARRKQARAEERPEAELSAMFHEERAVMTELLSSAAHAGSVGAFQGANYHDQAFYRPQIDCVMFTRNAVPFCVVCRGALEAVIERHAPSTP
ncbi:MAG: IgA Peptidase M64 [Planctomycetota bacterium]|jgi:hypothetical protein